MVVIGESIATGSTTSSDFINVKYKLQHVYNYDCFCCYLAHYSIFLYIKKLCFPFLKIFHTYAKIGGGLKLLFIFSFFFGNPIVQTKM